MPKRIIYEITITDESVLDLIRHDDIEMMEGESEIEL